MARAGRNRAATSAPRAAATTATSIARSEPAMNAWRALSTMTWPKEPGACCPTVTAPPIELFASATSRAGTWVSTGRRWLAKTDEATEPVSALTTVADALPGLGIVAAVLGVVITMGSLGGPPEEIGEKVAAALVGTFLGILLCYGVAGPLSSNMAKTADAHNEYLHVLRVLLLSFLKGAAPMIAIEMGRRAIPAHVRPSFDEMEKNCKGGGGVEAAAA